MAAYRITFASKVSGGARDETTVAVRGEIDGAPAGVWSTTSMARRAAERHTAAAGDELDTFTA